MLSYILDGHTPIPEADIRKWGRWFATAERHVARDKIGEADVSTVFLGLDHNFTGGGSPVLFETMIFGGPLHESQWRYCTWEEAEIGHQAACALARSGEPGARKFLEGARAHKD